MSTWAHVRHNGQSFYSIGIRADGTLHDPNGYPDAEVREAVAAIEARRHERRSASAKKAAATKQRRQEKRVADYARRSLAGQGIHPQSKCFICRRKLDDPESIERGVGPECWHAVQAIIEPLGGGETE